MSYAHSFFFVCLESEFDLVNFDSFYFRPCENDFLCPLIVIIRPIMVSIIVNLSVRIKTGSGLSLFSFETCFCSCRHLNVNNGNIIMFFSSLQTQCIF